MQKHPLPEDDYAVLTFLADAKRAASPKQICDARPLLDRATVSLALGRLTKVGLIERRPVPAGHVYEIKDAGRVLVTQAEEDEREAGQVEVVQAVAVPEKPAQAVAVPAQPDSLASLIAALNQDPLRRPDDLDDLLVDLTRLAVGVAQHFPDVAEGLARIGRYVDDAYPKADNQAADA